MASDLFEQSEWRLGLAQRAEIVRETINGKTPEVAFKLIEGIINDAELVFGVWPDKAEADGVGVSVIKGTGLLANIASGWNRRASVSIAAIPCSSYEQAAAACRKWGGLH